MRLADMLDYDQFDRAVNAGLVDMVPFGEFVIVHYSDRGVRHTVFNPTVAACRGLLITGPAGPDSEVVGRPWPRFFDYGSVRLPHVTNRVGMVHEKLDGSLIVAAGVAGQTVIYNRRRPDTVQAHRAGELLGDLAVPDGVTAMFELIDPVSKVVVDYGDMSDIVLTGVTDSDTGGDRTLGSARPWWPGQVVHHYGLMSLEEAWAFACRDEMASGEGVVISWPKFNGPGFKLKMKHPSWVGAARNANRRR